MAIFERVTIIGLGLIGGSLAQAIKRKRLAEALVGCDENEQTLVYARSHKIIDLAMRDAATAVKNADLVILCVPPGDMGHVAMRMSSGLMKGAIVMDTASVKEPVMQAIAKHLPSHVDFIPAHPIAGSEASGIAAARADLFEGRRIILTPNEPLQGRMLETITRFLSEIGSRVEGVPPHLHDIIYAHVSHLPQLLSFACRKIINAAESPESLNSFTRLQASSAKLWADIFTLNREPLVAALDRYMDALWHIKGELSKESKQASKEDKKLARYVLLPRIVASCLITTVMESEKKQGFSFARYAGQGFADFTSPASAEPDKDIESISDHYLAVLALLQEFLNQLKRLREVIKQGDKQVLASELD